MTIEVTRTQVLAYRTGAHGLARTTDDPSRLAVLALGVQDTPAGSARLALAARLTSTGGVDPAGEEALDLVWSVRGAPHLHRAADLPKLAAALWPRGDADARARLGAAGERVAAAGVPGLAAVARTVAAWRAAVTGPMTKGEASAAVTARLPDALSYWCEGCGSTHVYDQLFRLAALPAGMRIASPRAPIRFAPIPGWPDPAPDPGATSRLITAYLRLLGPAAGADVAAFLGTRPGEVAPLWPQGTAEVRVDGRRAWLPESDLPALRAAEPAELVRLLPPSDPYLQARDRALLLPDRAHRAALWRGLLGRTGAVLVGAEIAGVWRARAAARQRLVVTVSPFGSWSRATRAAVEDEATRLATARGLRAAEVHEDDGRGPAASGGRSVDGADSR